MVISGSHPNERQSSGVELPEVARFLVLLKFLLVQLQQGSRACVPGENHEVSQPELESSGCVAPAHSVQAQFPFTENFKVFHFYAIINKNGPYQNLSQNGIAVPNQLCRRFASLLVELTSARSQVAQGYFYSSACFLGSGHRS